MMSGTMLRKRMVYDRLASMGEKSKILYKVLDRIEYLTISRWLYPIYGIILLFLATTTFLGGKPFVSGHVVDGIIFFGMGGLGIVLTLVAPIWYTQERRGKIREVQTMLASDSGYVDVLRQLKAVDPDMARNIRKHIP